MVALPEEEILETFPTANRGPIWAELFTVRPEIHNSEMTLLDRPGWRIELNEEALQAMGVGGRHPGIVDSMSRCYTGLRFNKMSYLNITEKPDVNLKYLIMAFAGWADAGEAATNTVKYIRRSLSASKFAYIDPEEFYDFTLVRPTTFNNSAKQRILRW